MRLSHWSALVGFLAINLACSFGGDNTGTWQLTEVVTDEGERFAYPLDESGDGFAYYVDVVLTLESGGEGEQRVTGFSSFDGDREDYDETTPLTWTEEGGELLIDVAGGAPDATCTVNDDEMQCDQDDGASFTAERQ